jgi:cytochrome c oxidase assembly protein subunit 15
VADCKLQNDYSPWPHRWAVVLACATFPLLWVGGLVTTTDAGMAVPDWPSTFGYNLFLYPLSTWLSGPWDVFVEHGHRLLASAVGLISIALVVTFWRCDHRMWVRQLAVLALVLVMAQGVLGGMRVLLNQRAIAMVHGFSGPLFFALTVAMVVVTSRSWRESVPRFSGRTAAHVRRMAVAMCLLVYLQIMLGAVLRHVPVDAEPGTFALAVRAHLVLAGVLVLHVAALVWSTTRHLRGVRPLVGLSWALALLLFVQATLGATSWIVKYAIPAWAGPLVPFQPGTIIDGGWLQTHIVTAHMAVGSLLLATSVCFALQAVLRLSPAPQLAAGAVPNRLGAAT